MLASFLQCRDEYIGKFAPSQGGYQLMSFRWVKYQKGENVRKKNVKEKEKRVCEE
jgi:hypothetical protein